MKYRNFVFAISLTVIVIVLVSGCNAATTQQPTATPLPPTETPVPATATPQPPTPTTEPTATPIPPTEVPNYSDKVDVGGYKLYIKCIGDGSPTLILDAPIGSDRNYWLSVLNKKPENLGVRVCIYDRAGQGFSEASPNRPRSSQDMAEDLHTLLTNAGIVGPYIHIGSAWGVYNVLTYRELYPDEVVGIILIDGRHPDISMVECLPPETEDENSFITNVRTSLSYFDQPKKAPETWDKKTSEVLLQSAAPLGDLPLVLVSRDPVNRQPQVNQWLTTYGSDFPLEVVNAFEDCIVESQTMLAALSSNSTQIFVEGGSIAVNNPERVIEAIRIILEQVQGQ